MGLQGVSRVARHVHAARIRSDSCDNHYRDGYNLSPEGEHLKLRALLSRD